MELLYRFGYGFIALCAMAFAIVSLWKNRRSLINITWALTNVAIGGWALGTSLYWFETDYQRALLLCRISLYAATFIPVFFTHFCLRLTNNPLSRSPLALAGYAFSTVMADRKS